MPTGVWPWCVHFPPVDRQTPVKHYLSTTAVADGNNRLVPPLGLVSPLWKIMDPPLHHSSDTGCLVSNVF